MSWWILPVYREIPLLLMSVCLFDVCVCLCVCVCLYVIVVDAGLHATKTKETYVKKVMRTDCVGIYPD